MKSEKLNYEINFIKKFLALRYNIIGKFKVRIWRNRNFRHDKNGKIFFKTLSNAASHKNKERFGLK